MSDWYLVLAPVAALAVLALVRFVGCQALLNVDEVEYKNTYSETVMSDSPVSYWRFQELHSAEPAPGPTVPNTPVVGGTAKDEMNRNDGTYKAVLLQAPPPAPLPPDSPGAPGALTLLAPGLLDQSEQQKTSMNVDGGYVEVPFSNSLNLPSFTVEALVRPEWNPAETGLYRAVVTCAMIDVTPSAPKAFGFGVFAGPDPGNPTGPDVWQIWLSDGTTFKPFKDPARNLAPVDFTKTNYLAVIYDDGTKKLNMFAWVAGTDLDSGVAHPLKDVSVPAYSPVSNATQSLLIGMHRPPIGSGAPGSFALYHPFKGRIQEVAIYSKALIPERVMSHVMIGLHV